MEYHRVQHLYSAKMENIFPENVYRDNISTIAKVAQNVFKNSENVKNFRDSVQENVTKLTRYRVEHLARFHVSPLNPRRFVQMVT